MSLAPAAEYFPQVDKNKVGLTQIHLDIWNGFVFLNFDPTPRQRSESISGEFGERYAEIPFGEFTHGVELGAIMLRALGAPSGKQMTKLSSCKGTNPIGIPISGRECFPSSHSRSSWSWTTVTISFSTGSNDDPSGL